MPKKDLYHDKVKNALIKDGWEITHDPLRLSWGSKDMYVDLGAEQVLAAERQGQKIAVEIKSFIGLSEMDDTEKALGQYLLYRSVMSRTEPDRLLYLSVHEEIYTDIFDEPLGQILIEDYQLRLMIFDLNEEVVLKWIP
ncbi:XisH family protein [candidate division KSB1 bacterium]|nr:XisH family protein [candidate division KSB1 bacterium]MBL7093829.1 XisH family protein [candidate division KSB1 bacterium]